LIQHKSKEVTVRQTGGVSRELKGVCSPSEAVSLWCGGSWWKKCMWYVVQQCRCFCHRLPSTDRQKYESEMCQIHTQPHSVQSALVTSLCQFTPECTGDWNVSAIRPEE